MACSPGAAIRSSLKSRKAELAALEAERDGLRHKSALLDPRKADPDLADEMVRKDLGLVRADEVVIPLDTLQEFVP